MAPQLLLQRPSDPSGATARALHLPALQPRGAAAHRLRPSAEEGHWTGEGVPPIVEWWLMVVKNSQ